MSFHLYCKESSIVILDEKKACAALKKEHKKAAFLDYSDDDHDLKSDLSRSKTFEDFMTTYGWELVRGEDSRIHAMKYDGPMPDHMIRLLETLAPFVKPESFLQFRGDEEIRCDFKKDGLEINGKPLHEKPKLPSTSIIPPDKDSFGEENSAHFTFRTHKLDRMEYREILGRVHIADLGAYGDFPTDIIYKIDDQRLRDYSTVRLASIALSGVVSAEDFAGRIRAALEKDLTRYFFTMNSFAAAEVRHWVNPDQASEPVSFIDREKLDEMAKAFLENIDEVKANLKAKRSKKK